MAAKPKHRIAVTHEQRRNDIERLRNRILSIRESTPNLRDYGISDDAWARYQAAIDENKARLAVAERELQEYAETHTITPFSPTLENPRMLSLAVYRAEVTRLHDAINLAVASKPPLDLPADQLAESMTKHAQAIHEAELNYFNFGQTHRVDPLL